jgi:hypothetical protein
MLASCASVGFILEIFIIFGIPFRSGQKSGRILRNASFGIAPQVNRDG